ncbi:MAG: hypothetical protein HY782_05315 [Chloroflexi bacterium]|nr:hypothetical protein [Chloroflexota bacterium]
MIPLFQAAWEIHQFLTRHKIPYAIIGGFAVQHWGIPRLTVDVDLEVRAPLEEGSAELVRLVLSQFPSRVSDPFVRARQDRVILISASNGRGIDVSFGVPGYEEEFLRRAVDYKLTRGKVVRICAAEDLVVHKCVAGRAHDLRDVHGVVARQFNALDIVYVREWLTFFDNLLPEPVALERFEQTWQAVRRSTPRKERKATRRPQRKK